MLSTDINITETIYSCQV